MRGVVAAALGLLVAGCGPPPGGRTGPPPGALPADQLRVKLKRYQQTERHERKFLVGLAEGDDLQQTTRRAFAAIDRQLRWVPRGGLHLLSGLYRVDKSPQDSDGRFHVLAVLDRVAAGDHLRGKRDERLERLRTAIAACRKKADACDLSGARVCLEGLETPLREARDVHLASRAMEGDSSRSPMPAEGRIEALKGRLHKAEANRKSMLVQVFRTVDGKAAGDLNAGLQAVVSGGGLKLASGAVSAGQVKQALAGNTSAVALAATGAGAGYVLVGRVDVKYAGSEMGQYFAFAAGQVKVVDTVCGRTVLQLTLPRTKGGHISRRQACDKAASNALSALTARLTAWMQRR